MRGVHSWGEGGASPAAARGEGFRAGGTHAPVRSRRALPAGSDGGNDPGVVTASASPPSTPRHVLVVEDNADNRLALRTLLELWGYEVVEAEDGTRAIELALNRRPQIALVDIGLPGMSGYEVAEKVRSATGASKPFLVALTGYGRVDDRRRALESGFDAHLVKPVDPDELEQLLARAPS